MSRLADNAFVELVERHRHEFYRYVRRNVWNPETADDVFASGIATAYTQLDKFEAGTNFRAWVFRILTNKCYLANRETQRYGVDLESVDESQFASPAEDLAAAYADPEAFLAACGDELHVALRQLNTGERSCLLLLTCEKYSYKEIAQALDMPVGTVMTNLARGRAKLRRLLLEHARGQGILTSRKSGRLAEPEETRRAAP